MLPDLPDPPCHVVHLESEDVEHPELEMVHFGLGVHHPDYLERAREYGELDRGEGGEPTFHLPFTSFPMASAGFRFN